MSRRIGACRVSDGYLGAGGRLEGGPAPELVASGYAHEIDAAPRLAPWLSLADIAHAVALAEAGAIPAGDARGAARRPARPRRRSPPRSSPGGPSSATPSTPARPP